MLKKLFYCLFLFIFVLGKPCIGGKTRFYNDNHDGVRKTQGNFFNRLQDRFCRKNSTENIEDIPLNGDFTHFNSPNNSSNSQNSSFLDLESGQPRNTNNNMSTKRKVLIGTVSIILAGGLITGGTLGGMALAKSLQDLPFGSNSTANTTFSPIANLSTTSLPLPTQGPILFDELTKNSEATPSITQRSSQKINRQTTRKQKSKTTKTTTLFTTVVNPPSENGLFTTTSTSTKNENQQTTAKKPFVFIRAKVFNNPQTTTTLTTTRTPNCGGIGNIRQHPQTGRTFKCSQKGWEIMPEENCYLDTRTQKKCENEPQYQCVSQICEIERLQEVRVEPSHPYCDYDQKVSCPSWALNGTQGDCWTKTCPSSASLRDKYIEIWKPNSRFNILHQFIDQGNLPADLRAAAYSRSVPLDVQDACSKQINLWKNIVLGVEGSVKPHLYVQLVEAHNGTQAKALYNFEPNSSGGPQAFREKMVTVAWMGIADQHNEYIINGSAICSHEAGHGFYFAPEHPYFARHLVDVGNDTYYQGQYGMNYYGGPVPVNPYPRRGHHWEYNLINPQTGQKISGSPMNAGWDKDLRISKLHYVTVADGGWESNLGHPDASLRP